MSGALKVKKKSFEELYEELCQLPDHMVGEILGGELEVSPRPSLEQANSSSGLTGILREPFHYGRNGGPGGWWILVEPEVHLDETVFVPDVAGWRKSRVSGPLKGQFSELAPDWVCEVISPSSVRHDKITKMHLYAKFQIPHYWLVDPFGHVLEVFELQGEKWVLHSAYAKEDKVSAPPFEAIEFNLGDLWTDSFS